MNRIETLLSKLAEECAEVAQRCAKAQQYGMDQVQAGQPHTNATRINHELQDLYALVEMIRGEGLPWFGVHDDLLIQMKQRKTEAYMAPGRDLATLDRGGS